MILELNKNKGYINTKFNAMINKTALTEIIIAVFYTAALLAPQLALSQNNNKNNLSDIIETGYGEIYVKNSETNNPIPNATVTLTPISVPGDSMPDPYLLTTPSNGLLNYEVLTFVELSVGIPKLNNEQILNSDLNIFDIQGIYFGSTKPTGLVNNTLEYQIDIPRLASGVYILQTTINNQSYTERFISTDGHCSGSLSLQQDKDSHSEKSSFATRDNAIYEMTVIADGYLDYQKSLSLATGDNGLELTYIDPIPGPPQSQDLTGTVYLQDDDDIISPAVGATVYVSNLATGETISTTTDADGKWMVYDFPINPWNDPDYYTAEVSFEYDDNHYAIQDVYYTTPQYDENTWSASDTIHGDLNALLPTKREGTSALHIGQHAGRGSVLDTVKYYLGNSFNEAGKQAIRGHIENMNAQVNNLYTFLESETELGNDGINFEDNNENTTIPHTNAYETPWNHMLYYTSGANTSLSSAESFLVTIHELCRGLGHDGVAWGDPWEDSIMEDDAPNYSAEDRTIQKLSRPYYHAAYQDGLHAISITYLVEELDSKKKSNAHPQ